jgi:DNA mismatch repair ATPase MutL
MKRFGIVSTAMLSVLLLGTAAFGYAQQEDKKDKNKQEKQAEPAKQQKQEQAQPQRQQEQNSQHQAQQQHQQDQNKQQEQKVQQQQQHQAQQQHQRQQDQNKQHQAQQQQYTRQQEQSARTEHVQIQRSQDQEHAQQIEQREDWQQHRASNFDSQHRTWQQRGGYNGYRVPADYFRGQYGRDHWFRVYSLPSMTRIPNTGEMTGIKRTTFTLITTMTDITCSTAGILAVQALPSASRCEQ